MENVHIVGIVQQWDQDKFKRSIINAVEGEVALLTGTGPTVFHPDFRVFPNPVSDIAWVDFNTENYLAYHLQVINSLGQEMFSRNVPYQAGTQHLPISMESFTPGIYFVRLTTPKQVFVEKLIKK